MKGLNLITRYHTDANAKRQPLNVRLYDKREDNTKNDYFLDMLDEVLAWGPRPALMTGDSWYSCIKPLKRVKKHQLNGLLAVESNRLVSVKKGEWVHVSVLDVPEGGWVVGLKDCGHVKRFRTHLKDPVRHDVMHRSDDQLDAISRDDFEAVHY